MLLPRLQNALGNPPLRTKHPILKSVLANNALAEHMTNLPLLGKFNDLNKVGTLPLKAESKRPTFVQPVRKSLPPECRNAPLTWQNALLGACILVSTAPRPARQLENLLRPMQFNWNRLTVVPVATLVAIMKSNAQASYPSGRLSSTSNIRIRIEMIVSTNIRIGLKNLKLPPSIQTVAVVPVTKR